mmetsp:Transcript_25363/g.45961  ORF Transcript_25363/g.45961 Transcript_25363/m.45961 type:complete len:88 (-) Transcript_25363:706-969(-)
MSSDGCLWQCPCPEGTVNGSSKLFGNAALTYKKLSCSPELCMKILKICGYEGRIRQAEKQAIASSEQFWSLILNHGSCKNTYGTGLH